MGVGFVLLDYLPNSYYLFLLIYLFIYFDLSFCPPDTPPTKFPLFRIFQFSLFYLLIISISDIMYCIKRYNTTFILNVFYFIVMNDLLQKISSHCLNFPGILYSTIKLGSKYFKEHFSLFCCCTVQPNYYRLFFFFRTLNHFDLFRQLFLFKVCFNCQCQRYIQK